MKKGLIFLALVFSLLLSITFISAEKLKTNAECSITNPCNLGKFTYAERQSYTFSCENGFCYMNIQYEECTEDKHCTGNGEICVNLKCEISGGYIPTTCFANQIYCDIENNQVLKCNSQGIGSDVIKTCLTGTHCGDAGTGVECLGNGVNQVIIIIAVIIVSIIPIIFLLRYLLNIIKIKMKKAIISA